MFATLYVVDLGQGVSLLCLVACAAVALAGLVLGPHLHQPETRAPWRLFTGAAVFFILGVSLIPWTVSSDVILISSPTFSTVGFILAILGLLVMARSRGRLDRYACLDGGIVAVGVGAVSIVLLALPAASISSRPTWLSIMSGLYPSYDIVILFLLLHLGFTTAGRLVSYRALTLAVVSLLIGDLGYAWIGVQGEYFGPKYLDLPYLIAYTFLGISALHPSMTRMTSLESRPVQAWSWRRLTLLLPALAAPGLLVLFHDGLHGVQRIITAVAYLVCVVLLMARALRAVHGYAKAQEVLRHQSTHDGLTGLPNRRALTMTVKNTLVTREIGHENVWMTALDLDGFRYINDGWGHRTGDQVLLEVARRIKSELPGEAFLARTGGDEFAFVRVCTQDEAVELAAHLRDLMREPIEADLMDFVVTVSVGLASATGRRGAIELVRDVDTALSKAKSEGRDRWVVFGEEMRERVRDRVELELSLRTALHKEQLWVGFQPIVDMTSEKIIGCEALLRWNHPTRGLVPPGDFIPIAEETGLITDIGTWVLGEAARSAARWLSTGLVPDDFFVSVNVSTRQLSEGLIETVSAVLQETLLPPGSLCLEITESAMLEHSETTVAVLEQVRGLGVKLAMDDFGTGYSSLSYLSKLPITEVKLDRSFVENLDGETTDYAIVRAVLALTGALRVNLIAEGVETVAQRDILTDMGVLRGQGWLWGKAVKADEFSRRYARITMV
ncbi:MAG: EAL domain-containing protein [Actinomycetales bacterium]|nr:EAL domain-containing protein [Actinomycetales bacterium]